MRMLRLIPDGTRIDFVGFRRLGFIISIALILISVGSLSGRGLNLGIDFLGGILIEVRAPEPVDLGAMRATLDAAGVGEVTLQGMERPTDVLIRAQLPEGGDAAAKSAVDTIRGTLGDTYDYRSVELVGPTIGAELLRKGIIGTVLAVLGIGLYVAFRFEWQFGVTALIATLHDVFVTVGLFSLFQIEFNTTTVAALLTLAGYSVNDTVIVFDRIRETLRKDKSADLKTIINRSINATLTRTVNTSLTTLLACLALLFLGGRTLFGFSLALTWGIVTGTFSSVYVGAAVLLYLPPVRRVPVKAAADLEPTAEPARLDSRVSSSVQQ